MRICFLNGGGLQAFLKAGVFERCDLLVARIEEGRISYQGELQGATRLFEDTALLSKRMDALVVCGVETDCCGLYRDSAIVAEKGRILGVADMRHSIDERCSPGAEYPIFDTSQGRMGVLVSDDIYFLSSAQSLCACGADFLVCVLKEMTERERVLARAVAFFCGVPLCVCAKGEAMIADYQAEEVFFSPVSPVYTTFKASKQYHLVQTRKRFFYEKKP